MEFTVTLHGGLESSKEIIQQLEKLTSITGFTITEEIRDTFNKNNIYIDATFTVVDWKELRTELIEFTMPDDISLQLKCGQVSSLYERESRVITTISPACTLNM